MGGVSLAVNIKEVNQSSIYDNGVLIYADIRLSGIPQHIESLDLNCFGLKVNEFESYEIYSDTYADVFLTHRSVIESKASAKVYWVFRDIKPMPLEASKFDVVVQKASVEECHKEEVWQYKD